MESTIVQVLENRPSLDVLEQRAKAEHLADLAGLKPNPWRGAKTRLETELNGLANAREAAERDAFAIAYKQYAAALEKRNNAKRRVDKAAEDVAKHERGRSFLARFQQEEPKNCHIVKVLKELPKGFTKDDLAVMYAFRDASAALHLETCQYDLFDSEIANLEAQLPVLADLRLEAKQ